PQTKQRTLRTSILSTPSESTNVVESEYPSTANGRFHPAEAFPTGARKLLNWPFISAESNEPVSQALISGHHKCHTKAHDDSLATIEDIASQLKFLPIIEKRLHEYYSFSQVALVPRPIISQLLSSIRTGLKASGYIEEDGVDEVSLSHISQLARELLRSSSSELAVTANLDLEAFCALFSEKNLRIETLGLIYTMAARSSLYVFTHGQDEYQDGGFIQEMGRYSNLSLRLARELAPQTNDLIMWLAHENLQLMTLLEGDASLGVWRRVGDLATDLLALDLNREAAYSSTPFFVAECRRRNFTRAYYLDKVFAAVFNRPPRIIARHADCKLPLDLPDDSLFLPPKQIHDARNSLTPNGWNTDGKHLSATWLRLRYILAEFREEIVEYQFRSIQIADAIKLRDISNRCSQTWNALPSFLQYNQTCWTTDLPLAFCHMHAKVYLFYLHIHFQIYRLIGPGDGNSTPQPELLEVSANMLETVIQMTNYRKRTNFSPRDLSGILLSYGLPCAIIVANAMETAIQDTSKGIELPLGIKASNLIRNLSVLVSQLENVSSPSETNQVFCLRASQAISRKLDHILDRFNGVADPKIPEPVLTPILSSASSVAMVDIDTTGFADFDHFDLADWAIDFDINSIIDE
ncbi:hypothetical protein N7456_010367, partial [Penicillium angulare]